MSNEQYVTLETVEGLLLKQKQDFDAHLENVQRKAGYQVDAVAYNPETKFVYLDDGISQIPNYQVPIMNHDLWMQANYPNSEYSKALGGSASKTIDSDREEDAFTDEYLGKYQNFKSQLGKAYATRDIGLAGAVITSNDLSVMKVVVDVSRVIGYSLVNNVLDQAVTIQQAPNLKARYRTWTGFEVMTNVQEGVIVEAKKGDMSESTFTIKKDVGAAAITIEAELTLEGSVWGDHLKWIALKMRKEKNKKIATAFNTATTTQAGDDFGPYTGDRSTSDPGEKLLTTINTLAVAGYRFDSIASHMQPKREYFQNTFIKGIFPPNPDINQAPQIFRGVPGIETAPTWYADNDLTTTTILFAYGKENVVLFQGPVRQVEIGRPDAEVREYYTRDFNGTYIVDQNGVVKVTGVTA